MGEEYYSAIKLITGEEVFALVCEDENEGDPVLILQNPVVMKMTRSPNGVALRIGPWMEIPTDGIFIVKPNNIITMTEVKDEEMISLYNSYVEDNDEDITSTSSQGNKTKLTNKMGYISSVEDARKMLENLYNLKDPKES